MVDILKGKRLYIIGIDAAPLWIIKENYERYSMKGFGKLINNGVLMDLLSTIPPMTGPSWPSMYTGFRPGEHGVPDFFRVLPNYTKDVTYYNPDIKEPFWDVLAREGLKSLVITPAMMVRLPKEDGVDMITGFPLPARFSSERVRRIAKRYRFNGEPNIEKRIKSGELSLKGASNIYVDSIKKRAAITRDLMSSNNYDMVFTCFTETDRIQHFSLNLKDWKSYVLPLYQEISKFIEFITDKAEREGARVIVVSDHGAQPIKEKFLMNSWLIQKGYASLKPELNSQIEAGSDSMRYRIRERVIRSKMRKVYDKLPASGKKLAKNIIAKTLAGASGEDYTRIHDFDFDMSKTRAFSTISNWTVCSIYLNDSRFEEGIVKRAERERIKRKLIRDIMSIKDKDGKRLMVRAFDADDYYENTELFIAPDVMAEIKRGYFIDVFGYLKSGGLFMKPEMAKRGDHMNEGIFGLIDYGMRLDYKRISRKKLYVYSISPTVTEYFGVKASHDTRYRSIA